MLEEISDNGVQVRILPPPLCNGKLKNTSLSGGVKVQKPLGSNQCFPGVR